MRICSMKIKVMVDANVLIYTFLDSEACQKEKIEELFRRREKYTFVTTTRIIDEVLFKLMVISSGKKLKQLKRDRELLKSQIYLISLVRGFLKDFNFQIYTIEERHYWRLANIIEEYGLLGNDALTMAIMKENNLKYIATFDSDFSRFAIENVLQ